MRRYALRDDQWEQIEGLLPGREGHVGATARDNRLFVEAVLYRYRAGIPWTATAPAFPGATCPRASAPGRRCMPALGAGPKAASGSGSSGTWRARPTTSTR